MNRSLVILLTVLVAFAIGSAAVFLWLGLRPKVEQFDEVDIANLPTISYCEMKRNPAQYSGRVVKIDGTLHWFMHGYFLQDVECSEPVGDKSLIDSSRTAISLNPARNEELYGYLNGFHEADELWKPLRIVTVGRFKFERPEGFSDAIHDRTPFHFEIYSIDRASRAE